MADAKISALTALASGHATGDLIPIVDVSDTTQAASGTTKKTTIANLLANLPGPTDAVGISFTGQSLTGSNASTMLNLAGTWDTSGTPTAIKLNVTDTASNAASLLMDLQIGGVSRAKVSKVGALTLYGPSNATSCIITPDQSSALLYVYNTTNEGFGLFGNVGFGRSLRLDSTVGLGWNSGGPSSGADCGFFRSAAGVVGVRGNSSNAGGALEYIEQTAPSAPSADRVRIYAQDNGAGKTQLMALFSSGAAQQIAIQP